MTSFIRNLINHELLKLNDLFCPYVDKTPVVIEPLYIDEDYHSRMEGIEIISNLSKSTGLPTMIATMRPDIDNPDGHVRNTTSRAFLSLHLHWELVTWHYL